MIKRLQLALAIALLFPFFPVAEGQVGLYANFSTSQLNSPYAPWIYGSTFGAYYDMTHLPIVNFGADLRASILGSGGNTADSGLIGPRAVLHLPLVPIKPYGEILVGGAHVREGQGFALTDKTFFDYGALGGADLTIFPRFDWRVVEFGYSWLPSGPHQKTLSTGIVFRLPIP